MRCKSGVGGPGRGVVACLVRLADAASALSQSRKLLKMFRYFPTNYVWNLSVDLAIEMGARIGEIEEMCAPLQEAAKAPDATGTQASAKPGCAWPTSCVRSPMKTNCAAACCRLARSSAARRAT